MPSMNASQLRSASDASALTEAPAASRLGMIAVAAILGLVLFRLVLAVFDRTELSTDEAQYWFWGREWAFGAYSKPPLIGWLIRLATDAMGQTVAAVRLPAVILHGATALVLLWIGKRLAGMEVGVFASLTYLTTPAVALGSALMTTDTPMLFFASLALALQLALADAAAKGVRTTALAVLLGLSFGLGLLSKHAMLFWVFGALAASRASPRFRIPRRAAIMAAATALLVVAPHLVWLIRHDFITAFHVAGITSTGGVSLIRPLTFLAEQALVIGPLALLALCSALRGRGALWSERLALALLVAAPLGIVLMQAIRGQVFANWAVLYLVPGALLAGFWFAQHRRVAAASLLLGLSVSLALPIVKVAGTDLRMPDGRLALARYLGHGAPIQRALDMAEKAGAVTLVAPGRSLMADLSWFGAESHLVLRTLAPEGRPAHGWELTAPFDVQTDPRPVALLWSGAPPSFCPYAVEVDRFVAPPGAYAGTSFTVYRLDYPDCLISRGRAE